MDESTNLFIYLDENLVRSLSSVFLNGYIDIRTYRSIRDKTLSGRVHVENRAQGTNSTKLVRDYTKGYKSKHKFIDCSDNISNGRDGSFEDRNFERVEEEIKRIYTSFSLHRQLMSNITSSKALKSIPKKKNLTAYNIIEGDYIELCGDITTSSIVCYLDALITLLNCCGTDKLNKLLEKNNPGFFDFKCIIELLSNLRKTLTENSTQDLIVNCGNTPVVLTTNTSCFLNNSSYIYDKVNCPCKIFGKVIKCCNKTEKIGLLRKSAQQEYYEDLMRFVEPYLNLIKTTGIPLPKKCNTCIGDNALLVLPISIYI